MSSGVMWIWGKCPRIPDRSSESLRLVTRIEEYVAKIIRISAISSGESHSSMASMTM
jgi:hypothetical protein